MKEYYVYLIQSVNENHFYSGITDNLDRRLYEHNHGKSDGSSRYKPYKLVWFKKYDSYSEARKHEKWLKKKNREYKLHLKELGRNKDNIENDGLPRHHVAV